MVVDQASSSSLHFELILIDGNTWSSYHTVHFSPPAKLNNYGFSKTLYEERRSLDPEIMDLLKVFGMTCGNTL